MLDSLKNWIYDFKPSLRLFESRIQHSSDPSITIVMTKQNVSHDCDDQEKHTYARTMTYYGLNDCTNLSNIIDIMNSLTVSHTATYVTHIHIGTEMWHDNFFV